MELRSVDPRTLKHNPQNPRRMSAGEHPDAQLVAGHRRVTAAIAAGLADILVLVRGPDDGGDGVRALSENVVRAQVDAVSQWRAIEALVSADWSEQAIATALALPVRTLRKLRLLAQILPGMLDQMALGDMPNEHQLRSIAAASPDEQASVWKKHKPKKGQAAIWHEIARALSKRTLPATVAKFDADLAQAYGIAWTDDLFSPGGEDARTTTQVEAFLGAQNEWLANNLPQNGHLAELDQYGDPKLPAKAMRSYGKPRKGDGVACYVDGRTGEVQQVAYTLPEPKRHAPTGEADKPAPKARPDLTAKGVAMIGDVRTDALHQALREAPIGDDVLIGLLVLALGGRNVQVHSGEASKSYGWRERIAETLTEGGVLTQDIDLLRATARAMLVGVLSCRENMSQSGMGARHASTAIGADGYLPNMATQEFLSCLSKRAMERTASANQVAPRNTGKETRAAMIAEVGTGSFVHPAALFPPTAKELEARRRPGSLIEGSGDEGGDDGLDEFAADEDGHTGHDAGAADEHQTAA